MKRFINLFIFILLVSLIFINYIDISESIKFSFDICINSIFPSIIPFMLLSNLLINYDFVDSLSEILGNIISKLFKVNKSVTFAFVLSLFTGSPSNAKYLKDLHGDEMINEYDIEKTLNFCHFMNPIFILGTVGNNFFNNKQIGLYILISHYFSGILIGLIKNKKKFKVVEPRHNIKNKKSFMKVLNDSIVGTSSSLLLILGIITTCLSITTILNNFLKINNNYKFIYGLLEVTQGLKYLSLTNINLQVKGAIAAFLISFGGISIHMQTFSILDNKKIRYIPYFFSRIEHALLSILVFGIMSLLQLG